MNKNIFKIALLTSLIPLGAKAVVCPLCTIAVGAGVCLSRWLGIDDLISGVWIGALILSMSLWFIDWLNKKRIDFFARRIIVISVFYTLTLIPLKLSGIIGHPYNRFCNVIDRLLAGVIIGSAVFYLANLLNDWLKKKNNGKVYFHYQKAAVPIISLIMTSAIIYIITLCKK